MTEDAVVAALAQADPNLGVWAFKRFALGVAEQVSEDEAWLARPEAEREHLNRVLGRPVGWRPAHGDPSSRTTSAAIRARARPSTCFPPEVLARRRERVERAP